MMQTPSTASPLRQFIRAAMGAMLPRTRFLISGDQRSGEACLTFDDGPHPEYTPPLLDMLREHKAIATFFVIGKHVERFPDIVRRMTAEGHAIGHHSFLHTDPAVTTARQLLDEVERTNGLLRALTGKTSTLCRPPHGKLSAGKLLRLWRNGQSIVLWNVDPKDFSCARASDLAARFESRPIRSGDIVLLHDNHPHAVTVLPLVIRGARDRGVAFSSITHWTTKGTIS